MVKNSFQVEAKPVSNGIKVYKRVLISAAEAPHFAMRMFTIEAGGNMPLHTNSVEHEQFVIRGRARIRIGQEVYEVGPGDVVFIPAGVPHDYQTIGQEPFEFICVVPNLPDVTTILSS